jgi:hypothetical protein
VTAAENGERFSLAADIAAPDEWKQEREGK